MKSLKKFAAILLSVSMLFVISSCNESSAESADNTSDTSGTADGDSVNYSEAMRGLSAKELVAEMKTGWNLGNTLDANEGETSWGNPVTTREMIDEVAKAGFDVLRIPTTWERHFLEGEDYKIDPEWMARVTEVVNYGIDNGMYVILNCHHETDWIKPATSELDSFLPKYTAMWKQIAENFAEYGDHLLFEGLNEPRIIGGENEWGGGTEDGRKALNILNKTFVETVRATGGNNEKRALLIPSFAAAVTDAALGDFEVPDDPNMIVSLHAYTPYDFTFSAGKNIFSYDDSVGSSIDWLFGIIDKYFTSKDIPVIITEYGSVNKIENFAEVPNPRYAENVKWVTKYLGRAKESGIPCVWWDNGAHFGTGELFGIFNRKELSWYTTDLIDAIMKVYK